MNIKKIGLTALAGSLVATSAIAGEMSVAGGASMNVEHTNGGAANTGKTFSMGNQLTFTGSGELDNGFPAPLEVPSTIIGFLISCNFASNSISDLY